MLGAGIYNVNKLANNVYYFMSPAYVFRQKYQFQRYILSVNRLQVIHMELV